MLDHEIERRMEELNAKVISLGSSNVIPRHQKALGSPAP
jgi:hypothetical protein